MGREKETKRRKKLVEGKVGGGSQVSLAAQQRKSNTGFQIRIRSESILSGIKDSYLHNLAKPRELSLPPSVAKFIHSEPPDFGRAGGRAQVTKSHYVDLHVGKSRDF